MQDLDTSSCPELASGFTGMTIKKGNPEQNLNKTLKKSNYP